MHLFLHLMCTKYELICLRRRSFMAQVSLFESTCSTSLIQFPCWQTGSDTPLMLGPEMVTVSTTWAPLVDESAHLQRKRRQCFTSPAQPINSRINLHLIWSFSTGLISNGSNTSVGCNMILNILWCQSDLFRFFRQVWCWVHETVRKVAKVYGWI
jgi:hypothetical protein